MPSPGGADPLDRSRRPPRPVGIALLTLLNAVFVGLLPASKAVAALVDPEFQQQIDVSRPHLLLTFVYACGVVLSCLAARRGSRVGRTWMIGLVVGNHLLFAGDAWLSMQYVLTDHLARQAAWWAIGRALVWIALNLWFFVFSRSAVAYYRPRADGALGRVFD